MNLSIVIVFSVSCADAKLVTDRAGIPILLIKVVRRPENTQHWPYLTGSPVSMNCLIILTYQDQISTNQATKMATRNISI